MDFSSEEIELIRFCIDNIDCRKAECPSELSCVEDDGLCGSIPDKMGRGEDLSPAEIEVIDYFLNNDDRLWRKNKCIPKGTHKECPHSTICNKTLRDDEEFTCVRLRQKLGLLSPEEYNILEREVQKIIINSLAGINWSLGEEVRYYSHETPIGIGRPDILLEGIETKTLYVIELKPGRAQRGDVGQLLSYVGWYQDNLPRGFDAVKGILLAREFDLAAAYALKANPTLCGRTYQLSVHVAPT
ncbi:MAG: DUF1016 family protein [Chloroflexi bacterium]|nr:DUF1016 family protein [Chloroflexota bacterium]